MPKPAAAVALNAPASPAGTEIDAVADGRIVRPSTTIGTEPAFVTRTVAVPAAEAIEKTTDKRKNERANMRMCFMGEEK